MNDALLDEPGPCAGCRFAERCGVRQLACDAFVAFYVGGSKARWQAAPRVPTSAKFAAVFDEPQPGRRQA